MSTTPATPFRLAPKAQAEVDAEKPKYGSSYKAVMTFLQAPFKPEDIEWKPSNFSDDGRTAKALAYVSARAIQIRLDKVVGPENWWAEYKQWQGDAVMCGLSIRLPDSKSPGGAIVITKWNAADETGIEGTKGGISSAFKRVATGDWGIGRQLYDLPSCWRSCVTYKGGNGKWQINKEKGTDGWTDAPPFPKWYMDQLKAAVTLYKDLYEDTKPAANAVAVAVEVKPKAAQPEPEPEPEAAEVPSDVEVQEDDREAEMPVAEHVEPGEDPGEPGEDPGEEPDNPSDLRPDFMDEKIGRGKKQVEGGKIIGDLTFAEAVTLPKAFSWLEWAYSNPACNFDGAFKQKCKDAVDWHGLMISGATEEPSATATAPSNATPVEPEPIDNDCRGFFKKTGKRTADRVSNATLDQAAQSWTNATKMGDAGAASNAAALMATQGYFLDPKDVERYKAGLGGGLSPTDLAKVKAHAEVVMTKGVMKGKTIMQAVAQDVAWAQAILANASVDALTKSAVSMAMGARQLAQVGKTAPAKPSAPKVPVKPVVNLFMKKVEELSKTVGLSVEKIEEVAVENLGKKLLELDAEQQAWLLDCLQGQ